MSSKEFCASGQHLYSEVDVVRSIFGPQDEMSAVWLITACSKCDSKFLKLVVKPL